MVWSALIGAGASLIGGALGRKSDAKRERNRQRDEYNFLADKGLTPQEIVGGGAGGISPQGTGESTLGNQLNAVAAMTRQQDFQQAEREKDRALQMRAQDMGLASARVSAAPGLLNAGLNARQYEDFGRAVGQNTVTTGSPEFLTRQKMMSMGAENVQVQLAADRAGVDLSGNNIQNMSDSDFAKLQNEFRIVSSQTAREAAGATDVLGRSAAGFRSGAEAIGSLNPLRRENWPSLGGSRGSQPRGDSRSRR